MTSIDRSATMRASRAGTWLKAGRDYLGPKRILLLLAVVLTAIGLAFNWSWLVAAGVAPLLLTLLPCAAMCALGLCMRGTNRSSCSMKETDEVARMAGGDASGSIARVGKPHN